ncbi:hypothetical protein F2Q69_00035799 [Brassica cretica]|uniref:Uncharacterized protein n=1 Tax=Brassica cretica TaxID=69181 RepID=A0A8S9SVU7_BRACR|nr:hypothetical protein F2Q69_00035799 [Brassica cretica]
MHFRLPFRCAVLLTITRKDSALCSCSSSPSSPVRLSGWSGQYWLLLFFLRFQLMLEIASPWVGSELVVFDGVFLVVGLPSIVPSRLGFQDLLSSLLISLVALPFAMFATPGLDSVFFRVCSVGLEDYFLSQAWALVCGVSLLELWSILSRDLWFFVGMRNFDFGLPVIFLPLTRFFGSLRWCLIVFICVRRIALSQILSFCRFLTSTYSGQDTLCCAVVPHGLVGWSGRYWLLLFFLRFQLMLGTASPWIVSELVVFDGVFIVVGLPSIVPTRLGFQDLVSMALPFAMFATPGLDSVFFHVRSVGLEDYFLSQAWALVCGVSLLELWSILSRDLWFFVGMSNFDYSSSYPLSWFFALVLDRAHLCSRDCFILDFIILPFSDLYLFWPKHSMRF